MLAFSRGCVPVALATLLACDGGTETSSIAAAFEVPPFEVAPPSLQHSGEMANWRVASGAPGDGIAVWVDFTEDGNVPVTTDIMTRRFRDGAWGPVDPVGNPLVATVEGLGLSNDGLAWVAWFSSDETAGRHMIASQDPVSDWSGGQELVVGARDEAVYPVGSGQLAVSGSGSKTFVWFEIGGATMRFAKSDVDGTDTWSDTEMLPDPGGGEGVTEAVGPVFANDMIWLLGIEGFADLFVWKWDGAWSVAETLGTAPAPDYFISYPQLVASRQGRYLLASWQDGAGLHAAVHHEGAWKTATVAGTDAVWFPSVAINDRGDAVMAWSSWDTASASRRDGATGAWSDPVELGPANGTDTAVSIDDHGEGVVVFLPEEPGHVNRDIMAVSAHADGSWSDEPAVLDIGEGIPSGPKVIPLTDGQAIVLWSQQNGGDGSAFLASRYIPAP